MSASLALSLGSASAAFNSLLSLSTISVSYAGFWVTRRLGGVVCRHFDDLDAVFKSDTCDDLRQLICAF
jgi:hypothetical protein